MKCLTVTTPARASSYEIRIGSGLLQTLGTVLRASQDTKGASRACLVSGENVFPLYGERVLQYLRDAGLKAEAIVFPAGEETKSLSSYERLLSFLTENKYSRSDCLIALGGGVTGDLTGFAAASYQRGIPYIQLPTTLLAAVDSSVGGKTAVNLPAAKNQVGAFYQPSVVLCDTDTLRTLPERELRAGYAEVIKYAVLGDSSLFELLRHPDFAVEDVIETCVRMKADIVEEDERDFGRRRLLNLGHTFGHAVEHRSNYRLLHGEAVAVGLAMMARAAVNMGFLDSASRDAIVNLLRDYGLPLVSEYQADELLDPILLDKKISSRRLHLVVPRGIGHCEIIPVGPDELKQWLEAAYD